MKITLLSILSLLLFASCSKQPDCDNEEAIKLAKELIIQEMKENTGMALGMFGIDSEDGIDKFVNENIELISVRPTDKDEELQKCDCATQISFKFSDELIASLEENSKGNLIISAINKMMTQKLDYNYTLQKIKKDDQLLVEGIVPVEELQGIFMNYAMIQNAINKENNEDNNSDDNTNSETESDADSDAEYFAIVKSEICPVYSKPNLDSKTEYEYIKGDTIYFKELKNKWYFFQFENDKKKLVDGYVNADDAILYKY